YAFSGCKSLEELTIPEGVKKLGTRIIADTYIEKIKIPSTVAESNSVYIFNTGYFGALGGDAVLTEVEFAEGMTKIPSNICYGANTVEKITIPSTVTSIGSNAFNGCSSLKGLTLPAGLTKLEDYAFSNCNSLTSITVPKSVTSIGNYAFENCTSLKSAVIEANGKKLFETEIRDYAFSGCTSLT
ncbi:leucine-rich repeat domain-containing protein, partial [Catenibacterium mitsuokai]